VNLLQIVDFGYLDARQSDREQHALESDDEGAAQAVVFRACQLLYKGGDDPLG
jgi:hypothetical protein